MRLFDKLWISQVILSITFLLGGTQFASAQGVCFNSSASVDSFPFIEDFDGSGAAYNNTWFQVDYDDDDWEFSNDETTSSSTGPHGGHIGNGQHGNNSNRYMHIDASDGSGGSYEWIVESPCMDLTQLSCPNLSLWYHMHGDDMGALRVEILDGIQWKTLQRISGEQQFDETDPWKQLTVDLSSYSNLTLARFRIVAEYGGSFNGDVAVDDIAIQNLPNKDLAVTDITNPVSGSYCGASANQDLTVEVTNRGCDTLTSGTSFDVSYAMDGDTVTESLTLNNDLASFESTQYTFNSTLDLSAVGTYDIASWPTISGDNTPRNDTNKTQVTNAQPLVIDALQPFFQDFDGSNTYPEDWDLGGEWHEDGPGFSSGTGPSGDHGGNGSHGNDEMAIIEASGGAGTHIMESPCMDLSALQCPTLSYWYHMYGDDINSVRVEVDDGSGWSSIKTYNGEQQNSSGDQWKNERIDLKGYGSPLRIRFVANVGSYEGDVGIDDIEIGEYGASYAEAASFNFESDFYDDWDRSAANEVQTSNSCDGSDGYSLQLQGVQGAYAETPSYDLGFSDSLDIYYEYRKGGPNCGDAPAAGDEVEVQYWDGSQWVTAKTYDGGSAPSSFTRDTIQISQGIADFRLRFEVQGGDGIGNDNWNFEDVQIFGNLLDFGIDAINSPETSDQLGINDVTVTVRNYISSSIPAGTTIPISFQTSLMDQPKTVEHTLSNSVGCNETFQITLGETFFKCPDRVALKTWTGAEPDGDNTNDTMVRNFGSGSEATLNQLSAQNKGFTEPDSIFRGNPVTFTSNTAENNDFVNIWMVNGQIVAENQGRYQHFFPDTGQNVDTVSLITVGNCGIDTTSKPVDVYLPDKAPVTDFVGQPTEVLTLDVVSFDDITLNYPEYWNWTIQPEFQTNSPLIYDYVNGTDSLSPQPDIRFFEPGLYSVCLQTGNVHDTTTQVCRKEYVWVRSSANVCSDDQVFDTSGFVFDDGGRDNDYGSNQDCQMVINPCGQEVNLTINEFDLKANNAFLRIYDGKDFSGEPLWDQSNYGSFGMTGDSTFNGFKRNLTAESGAVYIEFVTGDNPDGSGFEIEWSTSGSSPNIQTSIEGPNETCVNQATAFDASTNISDNVDYAWYVNSFDNVVSSGSRLDRSFSQTGKDTLHLVTAFCNQRDTVSKVVDVTSANQAPVVGFSANLRNPQVNNDVVELTDTSKPCISGQYWDIQPKNFQYVDGTDSLSENPKVVFNQTGSYDVTLVDTNAQGVNQVTRTGYINVLDYCEPTVQSLNSDLGISRVQLSNLDIQSQVGVNAYTSFANQQHAELEAGGEYKLTVSRTTALNNINYKVWIDTNRDGKFSSSELYASSGEISSGKWTTTLKLSNSIDKGDLRMRIGSNIGSQSNNPCGGNRFGEFEDYIIQLRNDQTPPEIFLQGSDKLTIQACGSIQGIDSATYAMDKVDGRIDNVNRTSNFDSSSAGTYALNYSVTDSSGNTGTATRMVEVLPDEEAPELTFNDGDTTMVGVNQTFMPDYQATDNCAGIDSVKLVDSNLDNSEIGIYKVTYHAVDLEGNTATYNQHVRVVDTVDPEVQLIDGDRITVHLNANFDDPGLQLSDNYWSESQLSVNAQGEVNTGSLDSFNIDYTVTDGSGNTTSAQRKVVVIDTLAPQTQWNRGDTIELDVYSHLNVSGDIMVSDNSGDYELVDTSGSFYQTFSDGNGDSLGFYNVTYVYADGSNNQSQFEFVVEVVDREDPVISVLGPTFSTIRRWDTSALEDSFTVSDNYDNLTKADVEAKGSYFSKYKNAGRTEGLYEIRYEVSDQSGNSTSEIRVVKVISTNTGIEEEEAGDIQVDAYPNPTRGKVQLDVEFNRAKEFEVAVVNSNGKLVGNLINGHASSGNYELDLSGYSAGLYMIRVTTQDGVVTERINLTK